MQWGFLHRVLMLVKKILGPLTLIFTRYNSKMTFLKRKAHSSAQTFLEFHLVFPAAKLIPPQRQQEQLCNSLKFSLFYSDNLVCKWFEYRSLLLQTEETHMEYYLYYIGINIFMRQKGREVKLGARSSQKGKIYVGELVVLLTSHSPGARSPQSGSQCLTSSQQGWRWPCGRSWPCHLVAGSPPS